MVDLTWREIRQVFVEDYKLYDALYAVYIFYIGNGDDSIDEIIEGIQNNIEKYNKCYIILLPYGVAVTHFDSKS